MDNGCGEINHRAEALICLVETHSDAFKFLEFTKEVLDQGRHLNAVVALPRHQLESHQIAQSVVHRQDLRGHAAFRPAYGLALSPPFAP